MNTTAKGTSFEKKVLRLLTRELQEGRMLFLPSQCKIFHRRGYYSRELEKDIVVDIAIETYLPGQSNYSFLTIVECKNYSGPVPVNDIKKFRDNLRQIGAQKGIIAAAGPFAEGVEKIAKVAKIGLLRILPDTKLQWELLRTTSGIITASRLQEAKLILKKSLYAETPINNFGRLIGYADGNFFHGLSQFFETMFLEERLCSSEARQVFLPVVPAAPAVGMISPKNIGAKTQALLQNQKKASWETPIYDIVDALEKSGQLTLEYRDSLGTNAKGNLILGSITFNPTRIFISKRANENPRRQRFTIAHELGHHCLEHGKHMAKEYFLASDFDDFGTEQTCLEDIRRMEWQANMFASYLLLPVEGLFNELERVFSRLDIKNKGFG